MWEEVEDDKIVTNPLNTVPVFKIKHNAHDDSVILKTRLCVQGFNQKYGIDYFETYAPTGKAASLRAALTYIAEKNLDYIQLDVKGAFLHSELNKQVYIHTPFGRKRKSKFLRLKKSLYGLKQAPRNWYRMLSEWIKDQGFRESECNPCLYLGNNQVSVIYFHVDDLLMAGNVKVFEEKFLARFKDSTSHTPSLTIGAYITLIIHITDNITRQKVQLDT